MCVFMLRVCTDPEAPSEPQAVEPVGGIFPSTNITVRFPLPSDHSTINHYLVRYSEGKLVFVTRLEINILNMHWRASNQGFRAW